MRVKKYVADSVQDAMLKVKLDLGKDAVILQSRQFKTGGLLGFFAKTKVEVTAAVDDTLPPDSAPLRREITPIPQREGNPQISALQAELSEMKEMMSRMAEMLRDGDKAQYPAFLQGISEKLISAEMDETIIQQLVNDVWRALPEGCQPSPELLRNTFLRVAARPLNRAKPIRISSSRQHVVAFIGPTGVGKTTTIAKLAAHFSLTENLAVGMITCDTFRVGAAEQLKTFGDILSVPVKVVSTPAEMKEAIGELMDRDIIFIDTTGRSAKNTAQISEVKHFLDAAVPTETFLVLSATTKRKDMEEIVEKFGIIPFDRIIFTKLDETSSLGGVYSLLYKTGKNPSYITFGQNIPDDIAIAEPNSFVVRLWGEEIA